MRGKTFIHLFAILLSVVSLMLTICVFSQNVQAQKASSPEPVDGIGNPPTVTNTPTPTPTSMPPPSCPAGQIYSRTTGSPTGAPSCRTCDNSTFIAANATQHATATGEFYSSAQWYVPDLTSPCNPAVENCALLAHLRNFYSYFIQRVNICNFFLADALANPGVHPESNCNNYFSTPRFDSFGLPLFVNTGICYYAFSNPYGDAFPRCMHYLITGDLRAISADPTIFGINPLKLSENPYLIAPGHSPTQSQLDKYYYTQCFGVIADPTKPGGFSLKQCQPNDCLIAATASNASPISLIWEPHDFDAAAGTVVNFSLDKSGLSSWTLWRASSKAPLLVILENQDDKITSGKQLFGSWTRGGKNLGKGNVAWRDGYEALATLDANGDGRVAGDELKGVGLWFDANRNGIRDSGEVQNSEEAGLKALFYKDALKQANGDVKLEVGFERMAKGRIVSGSSVDWYAPNAKSAAELASLLSRAAGGTLAGGAVVPEVMSKGTNISTVNDAAAHRSKTSRFTDSPLTGVWEYTIDGTDQSAGLLALVDNGDATFSGTSMVLAAQGNGKLGQLVMYKVSGEMNWLKNTGKVILNTEQGNRLASTISLDEKNILHGSSAASFGGTNAGGPYSYGWTAHRVPRPVTMLQ